MSIILKIFFFLKARPKLAAFILYIGVISLMYSPVIFLGKSLQAPLFYKNIVTEEGVYDYQGRKPIISNNLTGQFTDEVYNNWAYKKLIGDMYKEGQLPLWNPYQGAGVPLADHIGAKVFFPYQILESLAPVWSWDFFTLGKLLIAGFFTFLFLRLLNISWLSAFLAGLLFMFSGSFTVFMSNQMVNTAMMIPVLLWALERLFSRPNSGNIVLSSFIFALSFLSGTPGVILYALFLAGAYFAFRVITLKLSRPSLGSLIFAKIKNFSLIFPPFILGLGLSGPLIFQFIEFLSHIVNYRSYHGVASFTPWSLLGLIISPGAGEIPTFYRITPRNGLWDFLGGYTGILSVYLIILACLMIAILLIKSRSRHYYFLFFYFFLGFALFILLRDLAVPPFKWLGYLPFFNMVWGCRWAGPVWVFCLAIAGALGFELLKEKKADILEEVQQSENLKFFAALVLILAFSSLLALPFIFYYQSGYLLDFDPIAMAIPLVRKELSSMSWFASFLILGLAIYLTYSFIKNKNKNGLYGLLGLALLELWLWIPQGYNLNSIRFKFGLFIFGSMIVIAILKRKWMLVLMGGLLFFILYLFLDLTAPFGFPQRYNTFTESPYIRYLKNQGDYWRIMGDTTALMPNWASAFRIMDLRYINESGTIFWWDFYRKNNLDDILVRGVLSHWFTGGEYPELNVAAKMKTDLCSSLENSDFSEQNQLGDKIRKHLPFYSLLGVRYILTRGSDINKNIAKDSPFYFPLVYSGEINIFENRSAFPRAFVVYNVEYASSYKEAQNMLKEENFDLRRKIVLEEKLPAENYIGSEGKHSVSIANYGYNKVTIKAETDTPAILVLTDIFYPGWQAKIDGKPAKIYRVDGVIRGVYLPAGAHEVIFKYLPPSFVKGLITALLSFIACLILLILVRTNAKKILVLIIVFLLVIPVLYFYFQSFWDFISLSKFKSQTEMREEEELEHKEPLEHKEKELKKLYEENPQRTVINFIYDNAREFSAFRDAPGKKWLPYQFLFPRNSQEEVYVDFLSKDSGAERKILIYIRKIEDILNKPIFQKDFQDNQPILMPSIFEEWLKKTYSIPTLLFSFVSLEDNPQSKKTDANVYIVVGYFEKIHGNWILQGGDDLLAGKDLILYKYVYDCDKFDWIRQEVQP